MKRKPNGITHAEACGLVEDALERVYKTLLYVRARLDRYKPDTVFDFERSASDYMEVKAKVDHADLLCNINWYGAYLKGAIAMALALRDMDLLDFPAVRISSGKYKATVSRAHPIVNKSIFDLFMSSTRNIEWLLYGVPNNVELRTQCEYDKKGKIIGAESKFYKKEITRTEI